MTDTVLVEDAGAVRILTLNRPTKLNAANLEMQRSLLAELRALEGETAVRALVLAGAGRAFSAGGDTDILREIADGTCRDREELGRISIDTICTMLSLDIPVLAAVHGFAVGYAAGIVSLCDPVAMGKSAFLCDPHVQYGIAAGPATQLMWPRQCSELKAREILMSGRRVFGAEALSIGLCSHVCTDGEERDTAIRLAEALAALPASGIAATKRMFNAPLLAQANKLELETG